MEPFSRNLTRGEVRDESPIVTTHSNKGSNVSNHLEYKPFLYSLGLDGVLVNAGLTSNMLKEISLYLQQVTLKWSKLESCHVKIGKD